MQSSFAYETTEAPQCSAGAALAATARLVARQPRA
jgi:hypothetical protein